MSDLEDLKTLGSKKYPFNAFLLATTEDTITKYLEDHKFDLDGLTGDTLHLVSFMVGPMSVEHQPATKPGMATTQVVETVQVNFTAYLVANKLGVSVEKMPCLAVFVKLEDHVRDVVIVSIPDSDKQEPPEYTNNMIKKTLREYLAFMTQGAKDNEDVRLKNFKHKVRDRQIEAEIKDGVGPTIQGVVNDVISALVKAAPV